MKVSRIILIIILFIAFFEIGIFSSYTIVTSEVPDIQELIDMQINTISSIFSPENVGGILIKDPSELNVTNKYELADALSEKAQVDGVDLDNFTVTTSEDINDGNTVDIVAYGYASPKSSSTSITISGQPNYKIIATAKAVNGVNGIMVNIDSLEIESILKLQDDNDTKTIDMGSNSSSYKSSSYGSSSSSSSSSSGSSSSGSSGGSSSSGSSSDSGSSSSGGSSDSGSSSSGGSSDSGSSGSSGGGLEITMNLLRPLFALN